MKNLEKIEQVSRNLLQIEAIGDLMIESVDHDSRNWVGSVIKDLAGKAQDELKSILKDDSDEIPDLE